MESSDRKDAHVNAHFQNKRGCDFDNIRRLIKKSVSDDKAGPFPVQIDMTQDIGIANVCSLIL